MTHEGRDLSAVARAARSTRFLRLVGLPLFAAIAAFTAYQELGNLTIFLPGWVVGLLVAAVAAFGTLRLALLSLREHDVAIFASVDDERTQADRRAGTSRLLVGEVLHRGELEFEKYTQRVADVGARWIDLDVRHAYRVSSEGEVARAPDLLGGVRVTVSRDDFKRIRAREHFSVLTTAAGRALRVEPVERGGMEAAPVSEPVGPSKQPKEGP